jgi:ankyrin repeat protein
MRMRSTKMTRRMKLFAMLCMVVVATAMRFADSPVADAAMRDDIERVRTLLRSGADANAPQGDGMTALHWAAENGNAAMADVLLRAGAKVGAVTRIGNYTPLHVAAKAGSAEVAKLLLVAGSDANAITTNSGATPLHFAAASGSVETVTALMDHGAKLNPRESEYGQTPLMFAAAYNRADVIRKMIERGADPTMITRPVNFGEQGALESAASRRRQQVLAALRPEGQTNWTPTPAQMQAAIEAGRAVYNAPGSASNEPAPQDDQQALADGAVAGYAQQVGGMGGLSALHHAVRQGNIEAAMALLDWGADVNQLSGGDRTTPLLMATINGQFDIALKLIERKANPNLLSTAGAGPLYATINAQWAPRSRYPQPQAVQNQKTTYLEVMEALLKAGANPNVRLRQHLWYFAFNNCGNSNCGLENLEGSTPFWRAAYSVDVDAMKLLKAHGADVTIPAQRMAAQQGGRGGAGGGGGQRPGAAGAQRPGGGGPPQAGQGPPQRNAGDPQAGQQQAGQQQAAAQQQQRPRQVAQQAGAQQGTAQAAQQANAQQGNEERPNPLEQRPGAPAGGGADTVRAGAGVLPIHAAAGVGYGNGFAANSHRHAPDGWMPALKYIVEELGADVNARDSNGYTPLHHAAARGDNEMIMYLVEKGADVKAVARNGRTTADMANGPVQRLRPFPETVALLVKLGAINNNRCVSC